MNDLIRTETIYRVYNQSIYLTIEVNRENSDYARIYGDTPNNWGSVDITAPIAFFHELAKVLNKLSEDRT